MLKRSHWQIMNGKQVWVWIDIWLPSFPIGYPFTRGTAQVNQNTWVESLIFQTNEEWDIEFLRPFILVVECDAILDTYIGDHMLRDRLVWPLDKRWIYSVKSGYHWAHLWAFPRVN